MDVSLITRERCFSASLTAPQSETSQTRTLDSLQKLQQEREDLERELKVLRTQESPHNAARKLIGFTLQTDEPLMCFMPPMMASQCFECIVM